jgi:Fic family protein
MSILSHKFPPVLKGIYDEELANQLARTQGAISALNQLNYLLLNPDLLMRPILGKEAESSAQLEGTQASLEDAYKIGIGAQTLEKRNQALEIRNYERAMLTTMYVASKHGLKEAIIREVQKKIVRGARGRSKNPGEYRKGDVWIGDLGTMKKEARYVAPDASQVPALMGNLLKYSENIGDTNPLIACAVIHHRFEAIHPFEDGNGRTGRMLISLFLMHKNMLSNPMLYPSGYFEKNKKQYINNLSNVDSKEDWRPWILFFLRALENQAILSHELGIEINNLFKESKTKVEKERVGVSLTRVLEFTFKSPYFTAPIISRALKIPKVTCMRYLKILRSKEIIKFVGEHNNAHIYANQRLLEVLRKI